MTSILPGCSRASASAISPVRSVLPSSTMTRRSMNAMLLSTVRRSSASSLSAGLTNAMRIERRSARYHKRSRGNVVGRDLRHGRISATALHEPVRFEVLPLEAQELDLAPREATVGRLDVRRVEDQLAERQRALLDGGALVGVEEGGLGELARFAS